jgi:hypothetical protein
MEEEISMQFTKIAQSFNDLGLKIKKEFDNITDKIGDLQKNQYFEIEKLENAFSKFPIDVKQSLDQLAANGWYLDIAYISIADIQKYNGLILDQFSNSVDEQLIEYCEKNIDHLKARIKTYYPERANIVNKALDAHAREEYELSIPVLLTQVDGICYQKLGNEFFRHFKTLSKEVKSKLSNDKALLCFLEPLLDKSAINDCEFNMQKYINPLNRHEILHGKKTDYANRKNSFKAISLLLYMTSIFIIFKLPNIELL